MKNTTAPRRHKTARILTGSVAALLAVSSVHAATLTWDMATGDGAAITDGSGTWSDLLGNWNNGGDTTWDNSLTDSAIFGGGTAGAFGTVTLGTAITAGGITFNTPNGGGAYTIDTSTFGLTLNTGITANESATIQSGVGGSILLAANNAWTVAATKTLAVSSAISGTGFSLTKAGNGTLTLSNVNTYNGGTVVNAGTLALSGVGTFGATSGLLTADGGTAIVDLGGTAQTVGAVSLKNGAAINNGTLTGTSFAVESGSVGAILAGSGVTLTKTTAGTVTLSGADANTYTGDTTISSGTLTLAKSANVIAVAGNIIVNAGGTLTTTLAASNQIADTASITFAADGIFASPIVDTVGAVTVTGGGGNLGRFNLGSGSNLSVSSLSLTNTISSTFYSVAANSANSTLTIGAGGLTMSNAIYQVAQTSGTNTAKIVLNGNVTTTGTSQLTSGGSTQIAQLDLGASARTFDITGTMSVAPIVIGAGGGINKIGSGALTLSGVNTFTGQLTVQNGTLSIGTINNDSANGTLGNSALAVVLGNTGAQTGTLSYTGTSATSTKKFTMATGGTGAFDVTNLTLSGVIDGNGGLTKSGTGTLTLSGTNTYTGGTTVSGGKLIMTKASNLGNGALDVGGNTFIYAPTAAGALNIGTGVLTLTDGSTIGTALGGTASQSAITSTGAAGLSGTGNVNIYGISGVAPTSGTHDLITAASGLDAGTYTLGTVFNNTNFTVSGFTRAPGAISVTATAATALSGNVLWKGGLAGNTGVWAASTGLSGGESNFQVTDGVNQPLAPGATADLVFSTATAPGTMAGMTLGADMTLRTLTVSNTATAFGLGADGFTLTLTPASATTGLTINSGALASTIAVPVVLGASQSWTNNSVNALTVSGVVSGAFDLTKAGTGSLALTAANTYSGTTTINGGTIALSGSGTINASTGLTLRGGSLTLTNASAAAAALDRVSSAAITANGGTISLANTSGATVYAETIGSVALTSGQTNFVFSNNMASTGSQTLSLSGLTRSGGTNTSAVNFASNSGLNTTKNMIVVTGATATTAGQIIGPWATAGNTAGANDYAVYNGSAQVVPANMTGTGEASWLVATDAYNNNVVTQTLGATRTITALRNTAATATLTLATGLNLETYGLLNGATTLFTVAPGTGGVLTTPSGGGHLHVNAGNATTGGAITISAPVNNNGTVTLVKNGLGTLTLSSTTSTYSGGTVINAGQIDISADTNLGAAGAGITFNGSANLRVTTAIGASTRPITINNGALASFGGNTNFTTTGNVTGTGGVNASNFNFGSTITLNGTGNNFDGPLILAIGGSGGNAYNIKVASLSDSATANGAIIYGGTSTHSTSNLFEYTTAAIAPLTLNNRQITFAATTVGGRISNNNATTANKITINTDLAITGVGAKTLTLEGTNTGTNTFAGKIADGTAGGASVISLTKAGAGLWNLSGTNTYTGTTVNGFNNPAGAGLVFQGIQALSPSTTLSQTHVGGVGGFGTFKILDDAASQASRSAVNLNMASSNTSNGMTLFVGNNNTSNGGTSSGTTTGSTIALGNLTMNQTVVGNTNQTLFVTGANTYRLQINNVTLNTNTGLTAWSGIFNPSSAPLTIAGNVTQTNASATVSAILQLDGTAAGNQINGTISNPVSGAALRITKAGTGDWTLSNAGNTFTGTIASSGTTTSAGTLSYASAGGTNPITVTQTTSTFILKYTGAGQTMSGLIQANALSTGTLTLDASGSGAINYSNVGSLGVGGASGAKNLTLTGNNAGANTLAGLWANNTLGGAATLTKTGTGSWVLSNANAYTGGTTVSNGTLVLNGANTGTGVIRGVVTIASGATLQLASANALGYTAGMKVDTVSINGGLLDDVVNGDQGFNQTYNLTGGTMRSNGGTSDATASQWYAFGPGTAVNSLASATTSTIEGRIILRPDSGNTNTTFTVANGAASTDLLISAAITKSELQPEAVGITKAGMGLMQLTGGNTYIGVTNIAQGTLSASSIVVSGGASNLGNATSAVVLGDATNKGTLSYAGSTAAYTRGFTVSAGGGEINTTTGGQTLSISGGITSGTDTSLTIGGAGNTTLTTAVALGATTGLLTKAGAGVLNINSGAQTYATLTTTAGAGVTNVSTAIGSGTTTVNANSTMNFYASQTLAALNIAAGVEVTFGDGLPFADGPGKNGALVPEPGTLGLLLVGALGVLNRRRRQA